MLECPYCRKKFSLTWKAHLLGSFKGYECPSCLQRSNLQASEIFLGIERFLPALLFCIICDTVWQCINYRKSFPWDLLVYAPITVIFLFVFTKFIRNCFGWLLKEPATTFDSPQTEVAIQLCVSFYFMGVISNLVSHAPIEFEVWILFGLISLVGIVFGIWGFCKAGIKNKFRALCALIFFAMPWSYMAYGELTVYWRRSDLTKLYSRCYNEGIKEVSLILFKEVDPNNNKLYASLLHQASEKGNTKAISLLLENGTDPNLFDARGRTPLHYAVSSYYANNAVFNLLIKNGGDVNIRDKVFHETPLHEAAQKGHIEAVKFLLEHGAKPNLLDDQGRSPLNHAILSNCNNAYEVAKLLIENGANVNIRDNYGNTPISMAIFWKKNQALAQLLADSGAEYSISESAAIEEMTKVE